MTEKEAHALPPQEGPPEPETSEGPSEKGKYAIAISLGVPIGILLGLLIFDSASLGAALSVILTPPIYYVLTK